MFKQGVLLIVLAAFGTLALFSFAIMAGHSMDVGVQSHCPLSAAGAPECPEDVVAMVAHHIDAFQSFLAALLQTDAALVVALLLMVCFLPVFSSRLFVPMAPVFAYARYRAPPLAFRAPKITRWLSLFENSPSFA